MTLKDEVVVVTGATRGLGRALVTNLVEAGSKVVVVGRSTNSDPHKFLPGTLEEVEADLKARGGEVLTVRADLSKLEDTQRVVDETLAWAGRCDVLIHNASYVTPGGFFEVPVSRWNVGWNITLLSSVIMMQGFLPGMLEREHGRVLFVGAEAAVYTTEVPEGWRARPDGVGTPLLYPVVKAGLERLSRGIHDAIGGHGVPFINLRAGRISSEAFEVMTTKMGLSPDPARVHTPDEIAKGTLWLLEHAEEYDGRIVDFRFLEDQHAIPLKLDHSKELWEEV